MGVLGRTWQREWWWVFLFSVLTIFTYLHFIEEKKMQVRALAFRFEDLMKEKQLVLAEKSNLQLQIASQNDPSWIEMVLMRDLGVVPEGWLKVHFKR